MQFTSKAVAGYEQTIAKNVELWIKKIASEHRKSGDTINLAPLVRLWQFDSGAVLATSNWVGLIKGLLNLRVAY